MPPAGWRSSVTLAPRDRFGNGLVAHADPRCNARSTDPKSFQLNGFVGDALVGGDALGIEDRELHRYPSGGSNSLRTGPPFIFFFYVNTLRLRLSELDVSSPVTWCGTVLALPTRPGGSIVEVT